MSNFENAYDAWWNVTYGNKGLSAALHKAFEHVLARLSDLEAAQKKPDAPTPEQREPGWYWVYDESSIKNIMHFSDGKWATQEQFWHRAMPLIRVIGPRIQEPGE